MPDITTMTIKEYVDAYTSKDPVRFREIWAEVKEFAVEVVKGNKVGMKEEWGDVVHFSQLWLYWRFGVNGILWKGSLGSIKKFMDRLTVWQKLYVHVGLDPHVSNFCGNYAKVEKVVKQLGKFGVSEERAREAFRSVVGPDAVAR